MNLSPPAQTAPETNPDPRQRWAGPLLLAIAAAWGVLWFFHTRGAWSQAGYLHLLFARSMAAGQSFRLEGRPVYGDEAPLWVALLAGSHRLLWGTNTDWVAAGRVLCAVSALFFGAGLYRFASIAGAGTRRGEQHVFAAAVLLVVVLSPYWGAVAFSGSQVLAAAGLACWGCTALAGPLGVPLSPWRLLGGCLCAGLGPLLRPEMLFFSLCLAPLLFVRWVNTPLRFGQRLSVFLAGMVFALGPGAFWLVYSIRHFETALPNPLGAGEAAPGDFILGQILRCGCLGFPWLLIGAIGAMWAGFRRADPSRASIQPIWRSLEPSGWVPLAWALPTAVFYLALHLAIRPEEVLLTAPALSVSLAVMLRTSRPRFASLGQAVSLLYGCALSLLLTWPALSVERAIGQDQRDLAAAIRPLAAADRVALAPVGAVAFLSGHAVVDLDGNLDPAAVPFRWELADNRRVRWAQAQGARYLVLDHLPEPGSTPVWSRDLPRTPWILRFTGEPRPSRLVLWHLPPSPTLPPLAALPEADQ